MNAKRSQRLRVLAVLCAGALGAAGAGAQAGLQAGGRVTVHDLIDQLASPSFVDRELATNELKSRVSVTLEQLEDALSVDELTLEQRRRLTLAAKYRFETEPRAAMGISLGPTTDLGLRINGTTPGFDADAKLQAGDIISSIDGVEIRTTTDLQYSIVSHSPGAVVPVRYVRDAARGEVEIRLGAWSDLSVQATPSWDVLQTAWEHRSRAYRSLITPERLPTLGTPPSGEPSDLPGGSRRGVRRDTPIVGGEPRDAAVRAAGIGIDRRLSSRLDERGSDFAGLVAQTLRELEDRATDKRDRIERVIRERDRIRERGDKARADEYEQQRLNLVQELELLTDKIERYRAVQQRDR